MSNDINHVHFSLIISIGLLASIYLYLQNLGIRVFKTLILSCIAIFLLFYLHYNGVRGGIAGFYISLIILLSFYRKQLNKKKVMMIITMLLVFLTIMFSGAPHFKNKIVNTAISLTQFCTSEKISNISDFGRFESIRAGIEVEQINPLVGVGLGDLKDEMSKRSELPLLPHNQFVFIFAFSGILGLLVVAFNLTKHLFLKTRVPVFFLAFNSIFYFSFMIEHPLERQLGVGLFLYFNLLILSISNDNNESKVFL